MSNSQFNELQEELWKIGTQLERIAELLEGMQPKPTSSRLSEEEVAATEVRNAASDLKFALVEKAQ